MFSITFRKLLLVCLLPASALAVTCPAGPPCSDLNTQLKGSRLPSWGVDSGTANAYAIATMGDVGSGGVIQTGSRFMFIATHANTSASTLAVNGGSAIAIKKNVSSALASGDIALNGVIEVTYDGTNFQLMGNGSSVACSQLPAFTGDTTTSAGSCTTTTGKVNGVSYPTDTSTNTVPVKTSSGAVTYEIVPVLAGGSGTGTPSLVAGANVTITGSWPNQTVASTGGGGTASYPGMRAFVTVPSNLTWVNQGTSTQDNTGGYLLLVPQLGSFSNRLLVKAIPGFTTNVTLIIAYQLALVGANSWGGILVRESSSGKFIDSVGKYNSEQIAKWNSASSLSANYISTTGIYGPVNWEKVVIDSTNRTFYTSVDGNTWSQADQHAKTDFCTADQWGIHANADVGGMVKFLSFEEIIN